MQRVDPQSFGASELTAAVETLRRGGIVAFPTDTFYGLAVLTPGMFLERERLLGRLPGSSG